MSYEEWAMVVNFRKQKEYLEDMKDEIIELNSKIYSIPSSRISHENISMYITDSVSSQIAYLLDKKELFSKQIKKYNEEKNKVLKTINICESEEEKKVIALRYVEGKTVKEVSEIFNKSQSYIYKLQRKAKERIISN